MSDQEDVGGALFDDDKRREVERERALGRVLADLDDRIASLGARLDGVQEQLGRHLPLVSNGLGDLRGEVRALGDRADDPTTAAMIEVREELVQVTGRLAGLEREVAGDDVATRVDDRLDGIESRLGQLVDGPLADRLDDLGRRLADLDEDLRREATRDSLDPESRLLLQEALRTSSSALTRQDLDAVVQSLAQRLDDAPAPAYDDGAVRALADRVGDLRESQLELVQAVRAPAPTDPGPVDDVRAEVIQLRALVERLVTDPTGESSTSTIADELLRQRLDQLTRLLEEQESRQESTDDVVRSGLERVAGRLDELDGRAAALDERLAESSGPALDRRLDAVVREVVEETGAATAEQQRHLLALVDGLAASLDAETTALRDQATAVRAAVTESLGGTADELAVSQRGLVERIEAVLAAHQDELTGMAGELGTATTTLQQVAGSLEADVSGVREELAAARAASDARLVEVVADLRSTMDAQSGRGAELGDELRELVVHQRTVTDEVLGDVRQLLASATERGDQQVADVRRAVDERVRDLGAEVRQELASQASGRQELLAAVASVVDEVRQEQEEHVAGVQQALVATRDQLDAQVTDLRTAGQQQVAAVTAAVDEVVGERVGQLGAELTAAASRDEERLAELTSRLGELVEQSAATGGERLATVVAELRELLATAATDVEGFRGAVTSALDRAAAEQDRHAADVRGVVDTVLEQQEQQAGELRGAIRSLDESREQQASEAREALATMSASADARFETAVQGLRALVDAQEGRTGEVATDLRALVERVAATTDDRLDHVVATVVGRMQDVEERLSARADELVTDRGERAAEAAGLVSELRDAQQRLGIALDEARSEAVRQADGIRVALADAQERHVDGLADERSLLREELVSRTDETVAALRAVVEESVVTQAARTDAGVAEVREALDDTSSVLVASSAQAVDELRESVARLQEAITASDDQHEARSTTTVEEIRQVVTSSGVEQSDRVSAAVDEVRRLLAEGADQHEERSRDLESSVASQADAARQREDELARTMAELTEERQRQLDDVRGVLQRTQEVVGERTTGVVADVAAVIDDLLVRLTTSVDEQLREDRGRRGEELASALGRQQELDDLRAVEVQDQVAASSAAVTRGIESVVEDVEVALTESRSTVQAALAAQAGRIQQLLDAVVAQLDERGRDIAARGEGMTAAAASLSDPLAELTAVTAAAGEDLRALTERADAQGRSFETVGAELESMRVRLDEELARVRETTERATTGLDEVLAADREAARSGLAEVVRDAGNELTRAQAALTRGAEVLDQAASGQEETAQRVMTSAAEEAAARFESSVTAAWEEAARTFAERTASATEELEQRLQALGDEAESRRRGLEAVLKQETSEAVSGLTGELRGAGEELSRSVSGLRTLETALVEYLAERDVQLAADRRALVSELVEQFAGGMSERQRRRLAGRLDVPSPTVPVPSVADRLREVVEREQRTRDHDDVPAWDSDEDAPPPPPEPEVSDEAPADPSEPVPAAEPPEEPQAEEVEPTVSVEDDRERLLAVTGLGTSKVDVLLARFGDADAVAAASDDELLDVSGVGPSLLARIRAEIG